MIKKETILKVADNSGAKSVKCIGMYGNRKFASIGDIIMVAVQTNYPNANIRRRTLQRAVVIRTKYPFRRGGLTISFAQNEVVIIDKKNAPIGNRISGATVRELKRVSPLIVSMAEVVY